MFFRSDKTTEAGPEIVPGVLRVESAERGIAIYLAGAAAVLLGLGAVLWIAHDLYVVGFRGQEIDGFGPMPFVFGLPFIMFLVRAGIWVCDEPNWQKVRLVTARLRFERSSCARAAKPSTFLFLIVPTRSREYLVGDLEEQYATDVMHSRTRFGTWCWWWWQVFGTVGPFVLKRITRLLGLEMIRAWRRR